MVRRWCTPLVIGFLLCQGLVSQVREETIQESSQPLSILG